MHTKILQPILRHTLYAAILIGFSLGLFFTASNQTYAALYTCTHSAQSSGDDYCTASCSGVPSQNTANRSSKTLSPNTTSGCTCTLNTPGSKDLGSICNGRAQTNPQPSCTDVATDQEALALIGNGEVVHSIVMIGNRAYATIINNSDKSMVFSLSSYRIFGVPLSMQTFLDGTGSITVCPGARVTIDVDTAECGTQVDLWYGLHPQTLDDSNPYWVDDYVPHVLNWLFYGNGNVSYQLSTNQNFCSGACVDSNGDQLYDQCSRENGATGPSCSYTTPNRTPKDPMLECLGCNNNGVCEIERGETSATCSDCQCANGATNPPACNQCPAGKVLVNGQCVPDCTNGATNPPECNQCPAGQILVNGQCVNNCTNGATNPPACNQCLNGYVLVNGQCIPECTNGANNPPECNQCPAGSVYVNGKCEPDCTNGATNPPACNQCLPGYVFVNNQCIPDCTNGATNPPACNQCLTGYVLVDNQCVPNCTNGATNPPVCNQCLPNHTLVDGQCVPNCTNGATNPPACNQCLAGYVFINGQCIPDCTNGAINPPHCDVCRVGQVLVNGQCIDDCKNGAINPPQCNQCADGYQLVNNQCIPKCTNGAINPPQCNQCQAGFVLVNNQCIPDCTNGAINPPICNQCPANQVLVNGQCIPNCTNGAINPPQCNQCTSGYVLVNNQCVPNCTNGATNPPACNQCLTGYVFVNGQCVPNCTNGAINPPQCNQCANGYVFVNNQCIPACTNGAINPPQCNQCSTGYVLVNNQCVPNCTNGAINPPVCNQCANGYAYVNGQCIPNCNNGAINPPQCNQCVNGYTFVNGQCVPNCTNGTINPPACNQCINGYVLVNNQCVQSCTNGAINPPQCDRCYPGAIMENGRCVDKQCRACGCVEVESKNENGTDVTIVGDYQPFHYVVTVDNRSAGTNPVTVSQTIQEKRKFQGNDLNATQSFVTNEGAIEYPTARATFSQMYNAGGAPIFLTAIAGETLKDPIRISEGLTIPVTIGNDMNRTSELFTLENLVPVCSPAEIENGACLPSCKPGQNETTDFCSNSNGRKFSGIKIEIRGQGRTSLSPYQFTADTKTIQHNNQFMTSNQGRPVNNAVGRLYISKSYIQTGNAGGAFFGSAPEGINLSDLGDISGGNKNFSGIFSSLGGSLSNIWSYLANISLGSNPYQQQNTSNITRGSYSDNPVTDTIRYESDFERLAKRPDGARVYSYNNPTGTLEINLQECLNNNSTIVVQSGNLSIKSDVKYCNNSGSVAFVVLNGDIIIDRDFTNTMVNAELNGVYVVNSGVVRSPFNCPPHAPSAFNKLTVNGSLYGNINQLLSCYSYIAPPGQHGSAVSVNYSSRILTNTPVGLRSILGDTVFSLVVR